MESLNIMRRIILCAAFVLFVTCVIWTLNGGIVSVLIGTLAAVIVTSIGADISKLTNEDYD